MKLSSESDFRLFFRIEQFHFFKGDSHERPVCSYLPSNIEREFTWKSIKNSGREGYKFVVFFAKRYESITLISFIFSCLSFEKFPFAKLVQSQFFSRYILQVLIHLLLRINSDIWLINLKVLCSPRIWNLQRTIIFQSKNNMVPNWCGI